MATDFVAEAWSYLAIALTTISLRIYFKLQQGGWRKLTWDDLLMVCAGIAYSAETTAAYTIGVWWLGLANNNMTTEQRATLDPNSAEYAMRVSGSKMNVVGWFTYTALFWLLKCCWTIYYSRMTDGLNKMDVRIKLAWVLIGTTYIAALCIICFRCWPFQKQWQINPNPGNACQPAFSKLQVSFIMSINTITDLYLMAIPIPIIWRARLDTKRKISLLILFSMGWIVIIFGIIRCVTLVTVGEFENSESGPWSVRESFVAVLVSNGPVVFPLVKRWFERITGMASTSRSNNSDSYQLNSQGDKVGSNNMFPSKESHGKKKKFIHPLSIPKTTAWGSDEEIVTLDQQMMGMGGRGKESSDGKDAASATTLERGPSLEIVREEMARDEILPGPPRNTAKISHAQGQAGTVGLGNSAGFRTKSVREGPNAIMVTKQWEVNGQR